MDPTSLVIPAKAGRSEALALSSDISSFWTPASAGVTSVRTFYEVIEFKCLKKLNVEQPTSNVELRMRRSLRSIILV